MLESERDKQINHLELEMKKEKEEKKNLLQELQKSRDKAKKTVLQLEKKLNQQQREIKDLKQACGYYLSHSSIVLNLTFVYVLVQRKSSPEPSGVARASAEG